MMKNYFTIALFISFIATIHAQKVDLDKWYYTHTYRHLPSKPLSAEFTTYSVRIDAPSSIRNNFSMEQFMNMVNLEGWKRADRSGHLEIRLMFDDLIIERSEVKERYDVKKDKDNKEIGRTYYYWGEVTYSFAASGSVTSFDGKPIRPLSTLSSRSYKKTYKTSEYSKYSDASQYINNNRDQLRDQLTRSSVQETVQPYVYTLNDEYAFPIRKESDYVWIIDSKKHPESEPATEAIKQIKALMPQVRGNEPLTETLSQLKPTLDYLESVIKKYKGTEKADKKLRYSSYYSLSKLYLALDQPDLAIKYANDLAANDYDIGDAKSLIKDAQAVKAQMTLNKMTSRHFPIDVSKFEEPKR